MDEPGPSCDRSEETKPGPSCDRLEETKRMREPVFQSPKKKRRKQDDEIEDIVGDVKYTDSQKSVATTNVYSQDFTDSSSDKNNSSGKDTYVIECDSDDSEEPFHLHDKESVVKISNKSERNTNKLNIDKVNSNVSTAENAETRANDKRLTEINKTHIQCDASISKATSTSLQRCTFISEETFTQTSKTIFELAQAEGGENSEYKAIETQTSSISIVENKTIEYRIQVSGSHTHFSRNEISKDSNDRIENVTMQNDYDQDSNYLEIVEPLTLSPSDTDDSNVDNNTDRNFNDILKIVDEVPKDNDEDEPKELLDNTSEYEDTSKFDSENESLLEDEYRDAKIDNRDNVSETSVPKSVDNEVEELYNNLKKSLDLRTLDRPDDFEITRFATLTPLTEETTAVKIDSVADIKPSNMKSEPIEDANEDVIFTNNSGVRFKMLPREEEKKEPFKLPPIHNQSCPSSPHLNSLFGNASNKVAKPGPLPSLFDCVGDRWEIGTKDLAAGESTRINGRIEPVLNPIGPCHLPSIYIEGHINYGDSNTIDSSRHLKSSIVSSETPRETICIQEKIRELKMSKGKRQRMMTRHSSMTPESRSASPGSASPDEGRLCDVAERGCEALCTTVIKKLRTQSWFEVVEVLEELPKILEKFWCVITEQRIADLIRQVNVHVDSPRTQVARTACNTLAAILKNTNYTKKPDFYEAVTSLLVKTGSFSKPVRRAANVALDDIVCGVELSHAVTALCVHGVSHKSPLVRCASARLLVVCTALAGGGRELLRARPPTAAHARRNALRALSALLDDKNTDTRKYAERLYAMLRPLTNFEAYYLTDVDVDLASKQMKKYDQQLLCGPPKETR